MKNNDVSWFANLQVGDDVLLTVSNYGYGRCYAARVIKVGTGVARRITVECERYSEPLVFASAMREYGSDNRNYLEPLNDAGVEKLNRFKLHERWSSARHKLGDPRKNLTLLELEAAVAALEMARDACLPEESTKGDENA